MRVRPYLERRARRSLRPTLTHGGSRVRHPRWHLGQSGDRFGSVRDKGSCGVHPFPEPIRVRQSSVLGGATLVDWTVVAALLRGRMDACVLYSCAHWLFRGGSCKEAKIRVPYSKLSVQSNGGVSCTL